MSQEPFLSLEEINEHVQAIGEIAASNSDLKDLKLAFSCIDLTSLKITDNEESISAFAKKVNEFPLAFPEMPSVAAVCVYPSMIHALDAVLEFPDVQIASVAGGFPTSMTFTEIKVKEAQMAVEAGADEIDIVIAVGDFLNKQFERVHTEIALIKKAIGETPLKVILETGALHSLQNIWEASLLAMNAGADFIKTSTGKMEPAATPEAVMIMCLAIKYHFEHTGERVGIKVAGGIITPQEAMVYLEIVRNILGDEWLTPSLFRIGASRLANNLLTKIEGKEVCYF